MRPVLGKAWTRTGFSLLWGIGTLPQIVKPDKVVSVRQFFSYIDNWMEDLPAAAGNALVVAGLDASLDALTPNDGTQWLENTLRQSILSFQDEYQGQAALVFWLPNGRQRFTVQRADNAYLWRCGPPYTGQELPIGRALWTGAAAGAKHIMSTDDPTADLEGPAWIGLHLPRMS